MTANNILKSLRALKGYTQEDVAKVLDISVPTYNRKEIGQREFTLKESKALADLFGCSIEDIFFNNKCNTKGTMVVNTA